MYFFFVYIRRVQNCKFLQFEWVSQSLDVGKWRALATQSMPIKPFLKLDLNHFKACRKIQLHLSVSIFVTDFPYNQII